ncbi:MAG: pilin [Candidatus Zambryskibacteria bacterium]|nr:pilin [Candidatus Zambryskibacteria bacterium]
MKKLIKMLSIVALIVFPAVAFAQFTQTQTLITRVGDLIQLLIPITAGIALLVFFWGLAKFIMKAGDESEVANGKRLMTWGVIALFVLVTVWGLTEFIGRQLGIESRAIQPIPSFRR